MNSALTHQAASLLVLMVPHEVAYHHPHFTDKETEAQGSRTFRGHSQGVTQQTLRWSH